MVNGQMGKRTDPADMVRRLRDAADVRRECGDYLRAAMLYLRAVRIADRLLPPDNSAWLPLLDNLGLLCQYTGRLPEATFVYRRALRLARRLFGRDHTSVADTLDNLAALRHLQGHTAAAERLCGRALAIRERAHGRLHADAALTLNNLAVVYDQRGEHYLAGAAYRRALEILTSTVPEAHPIKRTCRQLRNGDVLKRRPAACASTDRDGRVLRRRIR